MIDLDKLAEGVMIGLSENCEAVYSTWRNGGIGLDGTLRVEEVRTAVAGALSEQGEAWFSAVLDPEAGSKFLETLAASGEKIPFTREAVERVQAAQDRVLAGYYGDLLLKFALAPQPAPTWGCADDRGLYGEGS